MNMVLLTFGVGSTDVINNSFADAVASVQPRNAHYQH